MNFVANPVLTLGVTVGFLLIYAIWTDTRQMIIRNWVCGAVVLATLLRYAIMPSSFSAYDFAWLGGTFVASFLILHLLLRFGPGDIKFLAAGAFWFGHAHALDFLFLTGVFGGLLAIATLVLLRANQWIPSTIIGDVLPFIEIDGGKYIPYGVGIGAAGLVILHAQLASLGAL